MVFWRVAPWFLCAQPVFYKDFHQFKILDKYRKKFRFQSILGRPKRWKFEKIQCWKTRFFRTLIFVRFFHGFYWLWHYFGRPWGFKKWVKIWKIQFRGAFGTRFGLRYDFGNDFEAILADFLWILEGFGRYLGRVLKDNILW